MDPGAIAAAKAKAQAIAAAALNPQKRKLDDNAQEPPAKIPAVDNGAGLSEMAKMGLAAAAAAGITPQPNALSQQSPQFHQAPAGPYGPGSAQPPAQRETVVLCPPNLVGRVIGRGGETINNLQMQSGCNIQIDQTSMGPREDRRISINGPNPAQVQKAVELVRSVMASGPGGGPAPMHQPGGGGSSGYAFNEVLDCPANLVGRVIGRGGETIKSLQMQNACHIDIDQSMPAGLPRKITVSANTQEAVSRGLSAIQSVMSSGSTSVLKTITGPCSQTIDCDASLVGRLIGRKGETINDMQHRSGCRIQIDQEVPAGMPRKVIISAQTDEQVRVGVDIVTNVMQNGPRRDVGGGAGGGFPGQPAAMQQNPYAQFYQMQQMQYAQYYQQQMQQQYGGFSGYGAAGGYPGYGGYPSGGYPRQQPQQQQQQPQQQQQQQPAATAPESTSSSPWSKYFNEQGRPYWHNPTTGVTQWEDPAATPDTEPAPTGAPGVDSAPAATSEAAPANAAPADADAAPANAAPADADAAPADAAPADAAPADAAPAGP